MRHLARERVRYLGLNFLSAALHATFFAMRKTALVGFLFGVVLGCLFGTITGMFPGGVGNEQPEMLSVNQRTGKAQLHIKGKPEIK